MNRLPIYTARDLDDARDELEQELNTGPGWRELVEQCLTPSEADAFWAAIATEYELRFSPDRKLGKALEAITEKRRRIEAEYRAQRAINERMGGLPCYRETNTLITERTQQEIGS